MMSFKTMLLAGLASSALVASAAQAQEAAPASGETANTVAEDVRKDDIVVQGGFRAHVDEAFQLRRDSANIVDYLPEGDISELASTDIADALEFIPGAVGTRYRGTVETISLRGLPSLLTLTTIDGRIATSKQGTRSVYMKLFPSEFFKTAGVYKSTSADLTEGGIAGTVVLSTPSPLSQKDGVRMSGQIEHTPFNENYRLATAQDGSRWNLMATKKFDLGGSEFGVTGAFNYMNDPNTTAQQYMSSYSNKTILGTSAIVPATLLFQAEGEKYKRIAGMGVAEWRSDSGFWVKLDGMYSDADNFDRRNFLNFTGLSTPARYTSAVFSGGALETAQVTGIGVQNRIERVHSRDNVYMAGAKFGYKANGWDVMLDVYRSQTNDRGSNDRPILAPATVSATLRYALDGFHVENINRNLNDPAVWGVSSYYASNSWVHDMAEGARFDAKRAIDSAWLSSIAVGASYAVRTLEKQSLSATNDASFYPDYGIGKIPAALFATDPYMNFDMPGIGGLFPGPFALVDHEALLGALARPILTVTDDTRLNSVDNIEKTWTGYAQANFGGGRLKGNLGVRVVNTRLTARGYTGNTSLTTDPKTGAVKLVVSGLKPATEKNDYTDVLPSLNLRYELTPKLQVRFSAGRAMARPEFDDSRLSQDLTGGDVTLQPFSGSAGNPQLDPVRANQVDLGVEWFPSHNSTFALTGYYKRVDGLVVSRVRNLQIDGYDFELSSPINANAGDVYGIEAQGRLDFDFLPAPLDGFGITANATWNGTTIDGDFGVLNDTDADGNYLFDIDNRNPGVEGFTKLTATGVLYYEKGPASVRLAARYASDRVRSVSSLNAPVVSQGGVQLDASASLKLTKNVRLQVQATNLTGRSNDAYYLFENYHAYYQQNGRSFFFGFNANF